MSLPIVIYGSHTCEDTAVTRDRLFELRVPFAEHDKEDDPSVRAQLEKYNPGSPRTPTVVFGDGEIVMAEPRIEELESVVERAGYTFRAPRAVQFDSDLASRPVPDFTLPSTRGGDLELGALRGWHRPILFCAHDHACRVCQGFARQLAARQKEFGESQARLLFVLQDGLGQTQEWADEFASGGETLADANGAVKGRLADYFSSVMGSRHEGTMLLILDAFLAPRAGAYVVDAGGLISPQEVGSWLQLLDYECDE